jgi:hypothetical protein
VKCERIGMLSVMILMLLSPVWGQGLWSSDHFQRRSLFPVFWNRAPRTHVGLFPIQRWIAGYQPAVRGQRSFFGGVRQQERSSFYRNSHWQAALPFLGYREYHGGHRVQLYSSEDFVNRWAYESLSNSTGVDFSGSLILKKGMSSEEAMRHLGSPVQRNRMGEREVWRYSGYLLVFESGALVEIR